MLRVGIVSLLLTIMQSGTAISQRPAFPDKAEQALRMQEFRNSDSIKETRAGIGAVKEIFAPRVDYVVESRVDTLQFVLILAHLNRVVDERSSLTRFNSLVEKLQRNASARIPSKATPEQRAKLCAAATIDIRRRTIEFNSRLENEGISLINQLARDGGVDIFGPDSLFAKVMNHQGLR